MTETRDTVQQWLSRMGNANNCIFRLDYNRRCSIKGENGHDLTIQVPSTGSDVFFTVELDALPPDNKENLFLEALKLNLFQQETHGGALAVDPVANTLVLTYRRTIEDLDYQYCLNIIQNLLTTAESLKEKIFQHRQSIEQGDDTVQATGWLKI